MKILVTYDVETLSKSGERRLRQVAKACQDYGQRVQNSVFECELSEDQLRVLENRLDSIIDKEHDSIRIYYLQKSMTRKAIVKGIETAFDVNDIIIV